MLSHSVVSDSCDRIDCSLPRSSVRGILQAKILEWVALSSPGDLPDPGIEPGSPALKAVLIYEGSTNSLVAMLIY